MSDAPPVDPALHRRLAVTANNTTWELIDQAERTPEQTEDMLRRAYAAAYHWARAEGRTPANEARACWLLSRVHLLAGRAGLALEYAEACRSTCERHGLADWDLAYAHEARGRALKALGRGEEAAAEWAAARAVPIAEAEDRAHLEEDLASGP